MRIAYILESPELGGGVKVVFQHARLLMDLGHQVTVTGRGPRPWWVDDEVPYRDRGSLEPLATQDLAIATWYETIPAALRLDTRAVAHFCQGFEGDFPHLTSRRADIDAAYRHQLPTFVVSPHLGERLRVQFGRSSRVTRPPLDAVFHPSLRDRPSSPPWLWVPGIYEAESKGVRFALEAVRMLRAAGVACQVLRSSTLPLSQEEAALVQPEQYLCGVHPAVMAEAVRRCDVVIFPCMPAEGFGLPALEGLASKVPVVASDLPSMRFIGASALQLVPPGDAGAICRSVGELLADLSRWRSLRDRGHEVVQAFAAAAPGELEAAVQWAAHYSTAPTAQVVP
jgi:glycosyltransferase involved in cell wall biosynthesis